jgi:ankyrin repeat protein
MKLHFKTKLFIAIITIFLISLILLLVFYIPQKSRKDIFQSVDFGDLQGVSNYLNSEGDVNKANQFKESLLFRACEANNYKIVKLLIDAGANVNQACNSGDTPLHKAQTLTIAKLLIEKGAKVNSKGNIGNTPLHTTKSSDIAKLLIENGAKVNAKNNYQWESMRYAVENMNMPLIAILAKNNANINNKDYRGWTPIFALAYCTTDIANVPEKKSIESKANKIAKTMEYILSLGSNMDVSDNYGATPLHLAIMFRSNPTFNKKALVLIKKGANPNVFEHIFGATPLHCAVWNGDTEIVNLLISQGASLNPVMDGYLKPLKFIQRTPHDTYRKDIQEILNKKENFINQKDKKRGCTPLHLAVFKKKYPIIKSLLSHGAKTNIKDKKGRTALDLAKELNDKKAINLLK